MKGIVCLMALAITLVGVGDVVGQCNVQSSASAQVSNQQAIQLQQLQQALANAQAQAAAAQLRASSATATASVQGAPTVQPQVVYVQPSPATVAVAQPQTITLPLAVVPQAVPTVSAQAFGSSAAASSVCNGVACAGPLARLTARIRTNQAIRANSRLGGSFAFAKST